MKNFKLFFNILYEGTKTILGRFLTYILQIIKKIPFFEKLFLTFTFSLLILLLQRWRWYTIEFDTSFIINHSIYTDDLLIFFILIFLIGFSSLVMLFSIIQKLNTLNKRKTFILSNTKQIDEDDNKKKQKIENRLLLLFRIPPLLLITFYYFLNIIYPERIALVNEAVFSWQFFIFGINLLLCWMTGILGIKYYAQYS